jgi:hypothetical protein
VVKTIINHHHHHHHGYRFNFRFNLWKIPSRVSSTLLAGQLLRPRPLRWEWPRRHRSHSPPRRGKSDHSDGVGKIFTGKPHLKIGNIGKINGFRSRFSRLNQ